MATYPQFPDGYNPSDFYSGSMAPPTSDGAYLRQTQNNPLGPSQGGSWPASGPPRLVPSQGTPAGYPTTGTVSPEGWAGLGGFFVDPVTNQLSYSQPSGTANGLTILPFDQQENLMDPGNLGYEEYLAAQAAEGLAAAPPAEQSLFDVIGEGIGTMFSKSPIGMGISALDKMGAFKVSNPPVSLTAAQKQQLRDTGRVDTGGRPYIGLNNELRPAGAVGTGIGNEKGQDYYETQGFSSRKDTIAAYNRYAESAGLDKVDPNSKKLGREVSAWLRQRGTGTSTPKPVTPGPIPGPATEQYDRFGDVKFPHMPPYKPGVDKEWLYFRKKLAEGGVVGYADGGAVGMDETADPRVMAIADAEDAVEDAMSGEGLDGEGEKAIRKFVEMFGEEAMQSLVMQVQQGMKMRQRGERGRQVVGPGGPTDDAIPAMIDGMVPAALSSGEFVMPVAAVAGAGGGDVEEGARQMQALSDSFQKRTA